ncbi:MAG: sigma-70 family RNA polymerase sigma factor [Oscillospiraceae bacterium]|jgi:RNA polymerase sigma factor (sigma-70 family)|nr:sigma-70 family RNA polymerase sigma factor [Oscillospiraceae bacterium]
MKMTEYQRILTEQHLGLVDRVIRSRIKLSANPLLTYDDLYQVGCMALCRAAMHYDQKCGTFEAFAYRVVYHAMIDHCRSQNTANAHTADMMPDDEGESIVLRSYGKEVDYDSLVMDGLVRGCLEDCRKRYTGVARKGIEAILLKSLGCSTREIADKHGTSVNNVNAWISRARSRLLKEPEIRALLE